MAKHDPKKSAIHPDVSKIEIGAADWNSAPVHYPDLVTGKPRLIGRVYRVHGRYWEGGRHQFWSNSYGDIDYEMRGAAYELAARYVTTRKVPQYL